MDIKYLGTGEKVNLIQKLDDGRYLIQMIFYAEYFDEMMGDCTDEISCDTCHIVDHVYDVPPVSVFDEQIKQKKELITSLEDRERKLRQAINDKENEYHEMKDRFKKYEELKLLDDYIAGKITHYVIPDYVYNGENIIDFKDAKCEYDKKSLKLLTLFGDSGGNLNWNLSSFSDGSGCKRTVIPCISYEDALEKLQKYMDEKIKSRATPSKDIVELAEKYGLKLPDGYKAAVQKQEVDKINKDIKSYEETVEYLKAKIGQV